MLNARTLATVTSVSLGPTISSLQAMTVSPLLAGGEGTVWEGGPPPNTSTPSSSTSSSSGLEGGSDLPIARDWTAELVAEYVVRIVLSILMVLVNTLVLVTLGRTPALRCAANLVIGSMAVTDLLVGVLGPAGLMIELEIVVWPLMCRLGYAGVMAFCSVSINHLMFVSVDRYILISRPLHYQSLMTKRRVWIFIAACWTWAATLSLSFLLGLSIQPDWKGRCRAELMYPLWFMVLLTLLHFLIPLAIMIYVHAAIFRVARRQQRAVKTSLKASLFHSTGEASSWAGGGGGGAGGGDGGRGGREAGEGRDVSVGEGEGGEGEKGEGGGGGRGASGDENVGGRGEGTVDSGRLAERGSVEGNGVGEGSGGRGGKGENGGERGGCDRGGAGRGDEHDGEGGSTRRHEVGARGRVGGRSSLTSCRAKLRAARLLALPCAYFYVSWGPWFLVVLWAISAGRTVEPHGLERFVQTLAILNSLGNPVLYAVSQPLLGTAMLARLKAMWRACSRFCSKGCSTKVKGKVKVNVVALETTTLMPGTPSVSTVV